MGSAYSPSATPPLRGGASPLRDLEPGSRLDRVIQTEAAGFQPASAVLTRREAEPRRLTEVPRIDGLVGGLEPGVIHLFYGSERKGLAYVVPSMTLLELNDRDYVDFFRYFSVPGNAY